MKIEDGYRSWKEFEEMGRRRLGTFQLCVDVLAKDVYFDPSHSDIEEDDDGIEELNFD